MLLRKRQEITGHLSTMQEIRGQMVKFVWLQTANDGRNMPEFRLSIKSGTWNIR